jgi:hypothetical protein
MRTTAVVILAALMMALSSAAQPAPDCRDDRGTDRCAGEQQKRVRELFGVESVEMHQAAGDQVRRVFYVDGYGRDLIAIAFVREPGSDPMVRVHFPKPETGRPTEPLQAAVPGAVWEEVIQGSSLFDRTLAPLADEEPVICLHAWVYTIEAVDPKGDGQYAKPPRPRRKTGDACTDDLVEAYAKDIQRAAIRLFPACAALDPDQHRNDASRLSACRLLKGDRLAAADALNRAGEFRRVDVAADGRLLRGIFASKAVVDWNGERNRGDLSAGDFWAAKQTEAGHANLFFESAEGETAGRVRLRGFLSRYREGPGNEAIYERAPVEQVWTARYGNEFQVESATVGLFKREPER